MAEYSFHNKHARSAISALQDMVSHLENCREKWPIHGENQSSADQTNHSFGKCTLSYKMTDSKVTKKPLHSKENCTLERTYHHPEHQLQTFMEDTSNHLYKTHNKSMDMSSSDLPLCSRNTHKFATGDPQESVKISLSCTPRIGSIKDGTLEAVKNGVVAVVDRMMPLVKEYVCPLEMDGQGEGTFLDALLSMAVKHDRSALVEYLVNNGASPNGAYKSKHHLIRAISDGRTDVMRTLLKVGVDLSACEANGKTSLHVAASCCNADVMNMLLDNGGDKILENREKTQGNTAMHVACTFCNRDAVMMLFGRGVEFNAVNYYGDTPLSKLLKPVTRTDDFHNRSRIALAKELVALGFLLAPMKPLPILSSKYRARGKHKQVLTDENHILVFDGTKSRVSPSTGVKFPSKEEKLQQLYDKLIQNVSSPFSLQQACRLSIIRSLHPRPLKSSITQLGLPQIAQGYILCGDTH